MNITTIGKTIPAMNPESILRVIDLENCILELPQVDFEHTYTLHGLVYTRTVFLPAGAVITGAHIKLPTTLIVSGNVMAYFGEYPINIVGYKVMQAAAGRKAAFAAIDDTWLTMIFATDAQTNEEAEEQFTDEFERLMTRKGQQ